MTFNTGNPIGSTDARDRLDNSENMDYLENSTTELTHPDRLGNVRKTRHGMEAEHDAQMQAFESDFDDRLAGMAFTRVGSFTTGHTLTDMRQVLIWEVSQGGDGREYGWTGAFPKVVAAGATPATSGGIGAGAWVDRTDVMLRAELSESTGAGLVGTTDGITVQAKLNAIAADKANTSDVNAALALKADASTVTEMNSAISSAVTEMNSAISSAVASSLSASGVPSAIASYTEAGGVGSYIIGSPVPDHGAAIYLGATIAGSSLRASSLNVAQNGVISGEVYGSGARSSLSGTWRHMAHSSSAFTTIRFSLWLRIA